jgi:hypothetical protein
MTSKHLAVTHETTVEDADRVLGEIAAAKVAILREEAKREAQVQRALDACDQATADKRTQLLALEGRLAQFVLAHPDLFRKPRMRKTTHGRYGLQSSTRTVISSADKVVAWLEANGMEGAIKRSAKPIGKVVTKKLKAGAEIPGAELVAGEIAKYELDPAVLEEL